MADNDLSKKKSGEMARALRSVSLLLNLVRVEGLEPPSREAPDPKSQLKVLQKIKNQHFL